MSLDDINKILSADDAELDAELRFVDELETANAIQAGLIMEYEIAVKTLLLNDWLPRNVRVRLEALVAKTQGVLG